MIRSTCLSCFFTGRGYGDKGEGKDRVERQPVIYGSKQGREMIRSKERRSRSGDRRRRSRSRDGKHGVRSRSRDRGRSEKVDHSRNLDEQVKKAKDMGVEVPRYFKPANVSTRGYDELMQKLLKRKMKWSNSVVSSESAVPPGDRRRRSQSRDGRHGDRSRSRDRSPRRDGGRGGRRDRDDNSSYLDDQVKKVNDMGVEVPRYFKPVTVRPHSYAELMQKLQKRKMKWSNPVVSSESATAPGDRRRRSQSRDGRHEDRSRPRDRRRSRSRERSPRRDGVFRRKGKTCLNTFRKKKKGRGAVLRSREKLLNKNFGRFENVMIRCECGTLNMKFYNTCSKCSGKLKIKQETYLDVERCEGNMRSTPISVGAVVKVGKKVIEKEIFVLPDADSEWKLPTRDSWICRNKTGLFFKGQGNSRKMYKRGIRMSEDELLPAVSERDAVNQMLEFLHSFKVSTIVCHGEDEKSLIPWLEKFDKWATFGPTFCNSQDFFKYEVMEDKCRLELMVEKYGDEETKSRYRSEKHSAAADAWALQRVVSSVQLGEQWKKWLSGHPGHH